MTADTTNAARGGPLGLFEPALSARRAFLTIERNAEALAIAQTPAGIVFLHLALLGLIALTGHISTGSLAYIGVTLAALAILPSRRWTIFGVASAIYFVIRPFRNEDKRDFAHEGLFPSPIFQNLEPVLVQALLAVVFLALLLVALKAQGRWPKAQPSRRPLLTLLTIWASMIGIGVILQPGGHAYALVWSFIVLLSSSLFFLAYLFADQKAGFAVDNTAGLGFARPFWGGIGVPIKGPAFLTRFEAKSEEALAATRLKSLKLIVWATLLTSFAYALDWLFKGVAGLPNLNDLIASHVQGVESSRAVGYSVLAVAFLETIVWMGAISHTLVAVIRMAGFGIPRGMARPLTARSLAEFWNRYVFYFKEVLVDFFFYPAFARYFKGNIALRTAFATFCAACLGNVLFSLVAQSNVFAEVGLLGAVRHFESYAFYAFMLACFLIASQLRKSRPKPEDGWLRYEVLPRVWVMSVFAFLLIFADESGTLRLAERLDFAGWLLFLR